MIDEIFEKSIETEFEITKSVLNGYPLTIYRFKTNGGTQYDVHFINTMVRPAFIQLIDGSDFCDVITDDLCDAVLNSIDIGFTISSRITYNNDLDIDPEIYGQNSNKNEPVEVMGKISYLINTFINDNPNIKIYAVGKNAHPTKIIIYKKIFTTIFAHDFILVEGDSTGYDEGAMYFINKSILK